MIKIENINIKNFNAIGIEINYPKTKLISITIPDVGYIMCGVLNTKILDDLHSEKKIIAANILGVKEFKDLLNGKISGFTREASNIGITKGMTGKDALERMILYRKSDVH